MSKSISDVVLTALSPMTFYRPADVAKEMNISSDQAGSALRELSRGGLVERIKEAKRVVYITKQQRLF